MPQKARQGWGIRGGGASGEKAWVGYPPIWLDGWWPRLRRAPHIKNDFFCNLAFPHLKDVNQAHFNFLPGGEVRPATIAHHFEGHKTIVHDAIFCGESLQELKLYILHRGPKLTIEPGYGLLSGKKPIEAIESAGFENNVICIQLKRCFDIIHCFAVKVPNYTV